MSDEFELADERRHLFAVLTTLSFVVVVDAVVFCVVGFLTLLAFLIPPLSQSNDIQIGITITAFSGILLIGFYYIYRYYWRQYEADGGTLYG